METKELIELIKKWNPYCEYITLSTIFAKMRFNKGTNHVINHGSPGTGKSRSTLELLKELDLGTEIIIDNTTTDKGLFETFQNYPEQDIILDECSTLLRSLKTQDMVKMAMEQKPLTWTKDGSSETTEPFKGNLIINANIPIADTVVDRCLLNKTVMNKEMSLKFNETYVENIFNKTDFKPFLKYLRKVLTDKKVPDLTKEEIKEVLKFTQERIDNLDKHEDYSRRIIMRELSYFQHVKKLFGSLNKEVLDFIKPFAETYITNTHTPGLIESIIGNGEIEKPILVRRIAQEGNYSEQHARKLINKEIDLGNLILRGKMISSK
jgi:hypothetical protein